MELALINLQNKVDVWIKTHGVRYFDISTNLVQLAEEVGEVGRIVARRYGQQSEKESDKQKNLSDELCDVLFVCFCIANDQEIEILEPFEEKLDKENDQKNLFPTSMMDSMLGLIIQTGKFTSELLNNKNKDSAGNHKNDLAECLSSILIYLLRMASVASIDLENNFVKRLDEKALRDHARNWNNDKLF